MVRRALFGAPTFLAHETEAVWEVAEHRSVYVEELLQHAGHSRVTLFVGHARGRHRVVRDD